MFRLNNILLLFLLFFTAVPCLSQELKTYSPPASTVSSRHNNDFTVQVRMPGGEWKDLFEYSVLVDNDTGSKATMVNFDFAGKVEVKVRVNNGIVHDVRIRPDKAGIKPLIQGNVFTFAMDRPQMLSVEVNGNKLNNLHVMAKSILADLPKAGSKGVVYFGPGVHKPGDQPGDVFVIPSNTTVFIDGGAVLQGKLLCNKVENVKIMGHGVIDQAIRGIEITHSKNVAIDGPAIVNPKHYSIYLGESQNISIKNVCAFSYGPWTDGIDMMSCSDVDIDNVFLRTSDDCIAIYCHRWNFYGNSTNVHVSNAVLWADVAHPINLGLHGDTSCQGDTIENVTFKDVDILEHDEDDRNYQGAMAICSGDFNLVRNVVFENIRVDEIQEGQLFNIRVDNNEKYCTGPGRSIENVLFRNISYTGTLPNSSVIQGYAEDRRVK
ncbi:MAG TPA: glycosyl hydrolase family 28 protein, partial [Paludibacter sp.]|nr:glycosyl hydrolase family 28 protein [Paludibacter sp.]